MLTAIDGVSQIETQTYTVRVIRVHFDISIVSVHNSLHLSIFLMNSTETYEQKMAVIAIDFSDED
jgi:hypothetical protein